MTLEDIYKGKSKMILYSTHKLTFAYICYKRISWWIEPRSLARPTVQVTPPQLVINY
jgi:hypothetical protein